MIGVYLSQQTRFGHHIFATLNFSNSLDQLFANSFSTLQGKISTHVVLLLSSWTKENQGVSTLPCDLTSRASTRHINYQGKWILCSSDHIPLSQ